MRLSSCMAHVINLATQTFLAMYSTSKHYDPSSPDADIVVSSNGEDRDPIGLVRAISVKVDTLTCNWICRDTDRYSS